MALDTVNEYSDFVSEIYDCAVDETRWTGTLDRLCQRLGGQYISLDWSNFNNAGWTIQHCSTWDVASLNTAMRKYAPAVPGLGGIMNAPLDRPISSLNEITEAEAHATPFYREWALPNGLRDGCVVKFADNEAAAGVLAFVTGLNREPVTAQERAIISYLSPHFRRAMNIADSLHHRGVPPDSYRATLEALALPILITDGEGRLRFLNGAGETLLSAATLLAIRQGRVEPVSLAARVAFTEALACAASNDLLLGRRGVGLRLTDQSGGALFAYVLPIGRTQARTFGGPGAAIFITASDRQRPPPVAVLMTMLDIDPDDARVMLAVAEGKSVDEAAEALGVVPDTVHTVLIGLYAKLGVSRPADLARIARTLSLPCAIDPASELHMSAR